MKSAESLPPSTFSAHRLAGDEVDEMEACASGTGEGLEALSLRSLLLLFQMRLHVHARLRASKDNQIGHYPRMTARRIFSLI
ncbi:hypothetical protein GGD63_004350 [Bradyrhizobium sp. cir1]|uniref:hypothetical protein n=1 Tax=Bradyrhizobium sp. cir1 TaxID=1445730 RepID=UPI001606CF3A|nr:hypothetical protein [Bradyrhizobium sp. cir1]MBB4371552.1 hypothetical protein [Bradyrhizobium sp. cir1]